MGAGKTKIGSVLASKLDLVFQDADDEIVKSAGQSIADIFELYGEQAFRDLEEKVITRLIQESAEQGKVISLGGGAVMNPAIASLVWESGLSVWLVASLDSMVERTTSGVQKRPLLEKGNPREILQDLIEKRYPVYQNANIRVETDAGSVKETAIEIIEEIDQYYV